MKRKLPVTKYVLGGVEYESKKEVWAFADAIKARYATNLSKPIIGDDHRFLFDLFQRHPHYNGIMEGGQVAYFVLKSAGRNHKTGNRIYGFYVITTLGKESDFGLKNCLKTYAQYAKHKIDGAYRNEIRHQIIDFKEQSGYGIILCEICGKETNNHEWGNTPNNDDVRSSHVDHDKSCQTLDVTLKQFKELHGEAAISPELIEKVNELGSGIHSEYWLKDATLAIAWRTFHAEKTSLRILCGSCNLTMKRK